MTDGTALATARAASEQLGYEVTERDGTVLAKPTSEATPLVGEVAPVTVTQPRPGNPHGLLSAVAHAAARDRVALLVADDRERAERLRETLADPPFVRSESDTGERTFHTGSDRIHLAEGGLALAVDDGRPPYRRPTVRWHETATEAEGPRAGSDERRLVVSVDGETLTVLDGVDDLACPGPSRGLFTHHYRREDDRLFHVYRAEGQPAGVFSGVAAMREHGFHPLPGPVVPEHLFHDAQRSPRRSWAVLDGESGRVTTDARALDG